MENRFDYIYELKKFNPYHDDRGRFATANRYSSFTIRTKDPGKQHWADLAIAREKDRDAARRAIDPKQPEKPKTPKTPKKPKNPKTPEKPKQPEKDTSDTIAGVKRGEPMTHDKANHGNANPNFSKGGGYRTNCQSCVVTYEARLRGYNVITKPNTPNSKLKELSYKSYEAWIDPKTGEVPPRPKPHPDIKSPASARKVLEKTIKPGERYTFAHNWKGRSRSGHIIRADRDEKGELRLFDPQSGKTYQGKDIDNYLKQVKYKTTISGWTMSVAPRILRVDNLDFNPYYVNDIMEPA